MKKIVFFYMLLLLSGSEVFAFENELSAAARRPGTNEIFIGGEFSTVMVLNSKTGKTIRSFKIENGVKDLEFTPDGKKLLASQASNGSALFIINPEDGKILKTIPGSAFKFFGNGTMIADLERFSKKAVRLYNAQGEMVREILCNFHPEICGFSSDMEKLLIVGEGKPMPAENNLIKNKTTPSNGYNVYNSAYVTQEKDGKGCEIMIVDVKTGQTLVSKSSPYVPSASHGYALSSYAEDFYLVSWDMFLKISFQGEVTPAAVQHAVFGYCSAASADGRFYISSSAKAGYIFNAEKNSFAKFDVKTAGESAYSADVILYADTMYLLAKDFTLTTMNLAGGKINSLKIVSGGEGTEFALYYFNGFTKKEDRAREAAIINIVLRQYKLPAVDLEKTAGQSDMLLGTFKSEKEAKAAMNRMKEAGLQYLVKTAPVQKK